jgi:hypothetical protein
LWRWLSRAVAQGVVPQEGSGRPHDPFRYRRATPRREAPPAPDPDPMAPASVAAPQPTPRPLEPVPPATLAPDTAASASPTPDALPPTPPEAVALPALPSDVRLPSSGGHHDRCSGVALPALPSDVRLPYPFSVMNPAEVPEEVWQRARAAKGSTRALVPDALVRQGRRRGLHFWDGWRSLRSAREAC